MEFDDWFASEAACADFLRRPLACRVSVSGLRGNRGVGDGQGPTAMCGMPTSDVADRARTIFEGTRKPLRLWFQAMWYVTNQKHGVSALGVQRILGLGGYQTAWTWLHKLRRAMVRPGRELLNGEVEVDETYVGGREVGVTGRKTNKKSIVGDCRRNPGSGHRSYPHGACRGRIRREPHSFRPNGCVPGSNDSNRWLASLQRSHGSRLRTPAEKYFRQRRPSPHCHAPSSSGSRPP